MAVDLDKLTAKFPREAIRTRKGGGNKSLDYVEGHTVIQRLNDATGNCWDWRLDKVEREGDQYLAYGTLTIPGLGSRQGIGVQKVAPNSGEDLIKGVSTDALKKAATLFGVALELYGPDYAAEEQARAEGHRSPTQHPRAQAPAQYREQPSQRPPQAPQRPQSGNGQAPAQPHRPTPQTPLGEAAVERANLPPQPTAPTQTNEPVCSCGTALTRSQQELSVRHYGKPLCPSCQKDNPRIPQAGQSR